MDWGGNSRELFATNGIFQYPSWSYDGSAIFFVLWNDGSLPRSITRVSLTDKSRTRIDPLLDRRCSLIDGRVSEAPDGTIMFLSRLVASNGFCGNAAIFTIKPDGTNKKLLTVGADRETLYSPTWSQDGRRVAFGSSSVADGSAGLTLTTIKVMNADGSGVSAAATFTVNTNGHFSDNDDICWSADGSHILFTLVDIVGPHIFSVRPDGSGLTEIIKAYEVSCGR